MVGGQNEDLFHAFAEGGGLVVTLGVGILARFSTSSGWAPSGLLFPRPGDAANAVAVSRAFDKADVSCCVVSKGRADDARVFGVVAEGVNVDPTGRPRLLLGALDLEVCEKVSCG